MAGACAAPRPATYQPPTRARAQFARALRSWPDDRGKAQMTRRAQGAEADGASLQPLLVDYFTRDGSTLMMALLRTSPQIAVGGGYPYERKYFSYLFRWAHLIERTEWAPSWNGSRLATLGREGIPMMGPPPWMPRELFGPDETGADLAEAAFRALWEEFSRRASEQTLKRTKRPDA